MAIFTTSVTINPVNDGSGRAEVTTGTPVGRMGRTITVTATPATGYQFLGFDIVEQPLVVESVDVGQRRDTVREACAASELGTNGKLYFTLNADGTPSPEISTDPAGNNQALEGYYSAGQIAGVQKYYSLQRAVLTGPLVCLSTGGGDGVGGGGTGVAYSVTASPAGFILRNTDVTPNPFIVTVKDVAGTTLLNKKIVYTSLAPNIFTVDPDTGDLTAVSVGRGTIRFSAKNTTGLQTEAFGEAIVTVAFRT